MGESVKGFAQRFVVSGWGRVWNGTGKRIKKNFFIVSIVKGIGHFLLKSVGILSSQNELKVYLEGLV